MRHQLRAEVAVQLQIIIAWYQEVAVDPVEGDVWVGLHKVQGDCQEMLCLIGHKGTGLFDIGDVHKLVVAELAAAEDNIAVILAFIIDILDFLQGVVNVFVKNAAEIILFNDTVDGLKGHLRADNADSDHMIFDSPFPIVGSGTQELTS